MGAAVGPHVKIGRNPKVVARELGRRDGGVLLHLESGQYHGVNSVGWMIWSLIDGTKTLSDLLAEVIHRVDDVPPQLAEDVTQFICELCERNLVTLVSPDTVPS